MSAISNGIAFNLLLANFKAFKLDIKDMLTGISSILFSDNTNSSSMSNCPISSGICLILFEFNINRRKRFNFPI